MADEKQQEQQQTPPGQQPAEAKKTEDDFPKTWEEVFKHQRFQELIVQKNDLAKRLADFEKAQADAEKAKNDAEREAAEEQGQYKAVADQLKAEIEDLKAKLEQAGTSLAEQQSVADQSKLENMRLYAAIKTGLPLELANRLVGQTPEEIEGDATKIKDMLAIKSVPVSGTDARNGIKSPEQITLPSEAEIREMANRRGVSFEALKQFLQMQQEK